MGKRSEDLMESADYAQQKPTSMVAICRDHWMAKIDIDEVCGLRLIGGALCCLVSKNISDIGKLCLHSDS